LAAVSPTLNADEAARQARTEKRREQLLAAAARLMERDGSETVSMQALASEAQVSVGLIYSYFGSKNDLLLAVIVDVLERFEAEVPRAIAAAGEDPVHRLVAAFRAYCEVIDQHRHAAVLTYRESKSLTADGRRKIKQLEVATSEPLRQILKDGITAEIFQTVDTDLVAYNLLLIAHAWALKQWYFQRTLTLDTYIRKQTALTLAALIAPRSRRKYAPLIATPDTRG
jgi:TetR/AcrR family transcriptional regulator, cholesterol catabolism regulator